MVDPNSTASPDYHKRYYQEHKAAILAQNRAYRLAHRAEILAQKKRRYQAKRAEILAQNARYREAHREEARAYQRQLVQTPERQAARKRAMQRYYVKHRAAILAKSAAYHKKHPELSRRWAQQHPERRRETQKRRRAAKRGALALFTLPMWALLKRHFRFRCAYCGTRPKVLTQDHITPLMHGGPHSLHNIVPACHSCNSKKGTRQPLAPVQPLLL